MAYPIEMIGKKFGKLLVLKLNHRDTAHRDFWLCKCDCGKEKIAKGKLLRRGETKSCGCLLKEAPHLFKYGKKHPRYQGVDNVTRTLIGKFERGAKYRKIIFDVTLEYLAKLFKQQNETCPITGDKLYLPKTNKDFKDANYNASLDRIDSSKGYIEGNVQWITKEANIIKWTHSMEELFSFCKKVTEYQQYKNKTGENI